MFKILRDIGGVLSGKDTTKDGTFCGHTKLDKGIILRIILLKYPVSHRKLNT